MPCKYCNSTKSPNADGLCPDCGRALDQAEDEKKDQAEVDKKEQADADKQQEQADKKEQADADKEQEQADKNERSDADKEQKQTDKKEQVDADKEQSTSAEDEEKLYPVEHWRCSWMYMFFKLVNAILLAVLFAGIILGLKYYDSLDGIENAFFNNWQKVIWIIFMTIPAVYLLMEFIFFMYEWFIRRFELRPKEIRLITGVVNMSTNSTLLEALWGIKLRQNILQRFFGTGRITLFSDDATAPVLHINTIGNIRERFRKLCKYQEYALDCSNVKVEKDTNTDTSVKEWRYSWRDLVDEIFFGIAIPAVPLILGCFFSWVRIILPLYVLLTITGIYWCWLIWGILNKIYCTKYTLNNATLIKESGIFYKRIDVYVLCQIRDCEMSQNLWQMIIGKFVGDVGNIILYLKWENTDKNKEEGASISTTKKDVLHGLADHAKSFELFKERWLRERHRRQA